MLDFWFELASPYSYLSATRIDAAAAAHGLSVRWRPFLLGPIFQAQGWETSPFRIYPAKGRYMWRDIERRCAQLEIPFQAPSEAEMRLFPQHTVVAARLALLGLDNGWGKAFIHSAYRAAFADHRDLADRDVLTAILDRAETDPQAALTAIADPIEKSRLRAQTEEAHAMGLFGAPSFTVGNELFWGDDRLEDALDWAKQQKSRPKR